MRTGIGHFDIQQKLDIATQYLSDIFGNIVQHLPTVSTLLICINNTLIYQCLHVG